MRVSLAPAIRMRRSPPCLPASPLGHLRLRRHALGDRRQLAGGDVLGEIRRLDERLVGLRAAQRSGERENDEAGAGDDSGEGDAGRTITLHCAASLAGGRLLAWT